MAKPVPTININVLGKDLESFDQRPIIFRVSDTGQLLCSDTDAIDYWGEFRGGLPWITPELLAWAKDNNGHWEWENPEVICFTPNTETTFRAQ